MTTQTALALPGDHNKLAEACQGVAGAGYVVNEAASYVTPVPFDLAPSAAAYGANWTLRLCPPQIVAPPKKEFPPAAQNATSSDPEVDDPLSNDTNCYAKVSVNTTKSNYDNLLGIPFFRGDWGELGTPQVYHFNTSADVRILDPRRQRGILADEYPVGADHTIKIPVGRNRLAYRADTLVSILDFPFIYIPKLPAGSKAYKELIENSGKLKRAVIKGYQAFAGAVEVVNNDVGLFPLDQVVDQNFRHGQLGVLEDIYNTDVQDVWVYDTIPPVLSARTDISAFSEQVQAVLSYDEARKVYYLEAIQPGGVQRKKGIEFLRPLMEYHDHCDRQVRLSNEGGGVFWASGSHVELIWTASDSGPSDSSGAVNSTSLTQQIEVRDSYPPVLLAPPSQVIEIPAGQTQATVNVGVPRAYDLADPTPDVANDAADDVFDLGLTEVTWTASDGFNSSKAVQLINVKVEGTNQAPTANAQTVETRSFEPIEIILSGTDPDFHPSVNRYDPLTFNIVDSPDNGFFVTPLLPFFIEDYRLEAGAQRFEGQPWQQDPLNYCRNRTGSDLSAWQAGYPYKAEWIAVDDDGNSIVYDNGDVRCDPNGDVSTSPRFAIFDAQQNLVANSPAPGQGQRVEDIFWHPDNGNIYMAVTDTQGDDFIYVYNGSLEQQIRYNMSSGPLSTQTTPQSLVVDHRGIMYVAGQGGIPVKAYRQITVTNPSDTNQAVAGDVYLGEVFDPGADSVSSVAADSLNNLYMMVSDFGNRIIKVTAASLDEAGNFSAGEMVGWLGYCSSNLTTEYACDTPNHRSVGFMCTDALCERDQLYGDQPGQFNEAKGIAINPKDILYVADFGNKRVQRFTTDGFFAGQAKSTGVGYGFLLGDFGNPDDIEINSDHFYILNHDANLLHVFKTTPITPIDDSHASVVYSSNNNYVGSDSFRFAVTDGLDSAEANVAINVSRNFRPPEIPASGLAFMVPTSIEDEPVQFVLPATDPDDHFDTLTVELERAPEHGTVTFNGLNATYIPYSDYNGVDSFSYRVFDGRDSSIEVGEVTLAIEPVEDTPAVEVPAQQNVSVGFRLIHRIDVFDPDANETMMVTIDWGDGFSTQEGYFTLDGNPVPVQQTVNADGTIREGVATTGPILNVDPSGRGLLIADHIYTRAGSYNVQTCAYDKAELNVETQQKNLTSASKQQCETSVVEATASAELAIEVSSPQGKQPPRSEIQFMVTLKNLEYELATDDPRYAELPSTGMAVFGLSVNGELNPHLEIVNVTSADGTCSNQNTASFDCEFLEIPYGSNATIDVTAQLTETAPGGAEPGLALTAESLSLSGQVSGAGHVVVESSGQAPTLTRISPASGEENGFTEVTLTGTNFESGAQVLFGKLQGTQLRVVDSTKITVLTPAHAAGVVDVTVINPDNQQSVLAGVWTYVAPKKPDTVSNTSGGGGGGGSLVPGTLMLLSIMLWISYCRRPFLRHQ